MTTDTPRSVLHILRDLHNAADDYLGALRPFNPCYCDLGSPPAHQFEEPLIRSARPLHLAIERIETALASDPDLIDDIPLNRYISRLRDVFRSQVERLGWDELLAPSGLDRIEAKLKHHQDTKKIPFLGACRGWRSLPSVSDHYGFDCYANEARKLGLDPMPLSPDEAEQVTENLYRHWQIDPVFGPSLPTVTDDEISTVNQAVNALHDYLLERADEAAYPCLICGRPAGILTPDRPCQSCTSQSGTFWEFKFYFERTGQDLKLPNALRDDPLSRNIKMLSCELFGHESFDETTLKALELKWTPKSRPQNPIS
ncbi:hypothetical protein BH23PLA1_BH23PLA1_36160 [soil metagenome]